MAYYILTLLKLERKNVINILIDILCLSLGLFIGLVFMSQASLAYSNYKSNLMYMPLQDYLIIRPTLESNVLLAKDLEEIKTGYNDVENILVFNNMNDEIVFYRDYFCPDINVVSISGDYSGIFKGDCLIGENINESNGTLVGEHAAKQYGIKTGDILEISNYKFYVSGILLIPQYSNDVLVLSDIFENEEFFDCQYYVKIKPENADGFLRYLEQNYGMFEVYTSEEYWQKTKEELLLGWTFSIIIAIVTLLYGLINIFNIETFFILKQKKSIAILRALGAVKGNIIMAKMVRCFVIAIISSSVTSFMVFLVENTLFVDLIQFHITPWVYIIATVLITVVYVIFSLILYGRHYNGEIARVISEP